MRSEIRDSEINELFEKVQKKKYGKYLMSIKITKLRGFIDKTINFDFPVTALIGPNGGGKTTILGAAGLIYKDIKPMRFFAKNSAFDNSMAGWKVEYQIIDKLEDASNLISKSASYGGYKWSRSSISRPIEVFGIARTVPPSEKVEFSKYAKGGLEIKESQKHKLETNVAGAVGKIIGRDVSKYSEIRINDKGNVTFLTGVTAKGIEYSEFHFGAGESSVIRMITAIESMPENSMILIEEIENGLHPIATRSMVEYLIDVAIRKKLQIIFTTHSNEALRPLPTKAIWVASNGELYQGKLDIISLRAITGEIDAKLAVFCEDIFSQEWIQSIIRLNNIENYELIEVHGLQGDGIASSVNKNHNMDPTQKTKSICFIDGDSKQPDSDKENVFRLPGLGPESYIYDKVRDKIIEAKGKLAVALHLPFEKADFISSVVNDVRLSNRDEHLLFSQVGEKLGFISENIVRNAFLSVWNEYYKEDSKMIYDIIIHHLPE